MAYNSASPIIFGGISGVVTALTSNSPQVGTKVNYEGTEYIYVYNGGDRPIYPGMGIVGQAAAEGYTGTVSSITYDRIFGVVVHTTMLTSTHGWVAFRGFVSLYTSAAIATGAFVTVAADGMFSTYTCHSAAGTGKEIGKVLVASSAATNVKAACYISV